MKHDISMGLYGIRLRPVTPEDVDLILELRGDRELCRFMGDIGTSRDRQLEWLEKYLVTPGDYYFVIETAKSAAAVGLAGIYNMREGDGTTTEAEWGRWVIRPGAFAAPASALISFRIAFNLLNVDRLHFWTSVENRNVIAFHEKIGARRLQTKPMSVRGSKSDAAFYEITREMRSDVEGRLEVFARQAERMFR